MVRLSGSLRPLEAAVGYALGGARLATPPLLARPTPCPGWDLEGLLDHLGDSIAVLVEAITTAGVSPGPSPGDPGPPGRDPVARLRGQAARLLDACATVPAERRVAIADRALGVRMVALTGAIELTVHGWDLYLACGTPRPVPPGLAAVLLPVAPLLITQAVRPGLFADPVPLAGPASPGEQLVAFCGRQPRLPAAPTPGTS